MFNEVAAQAAIDFADVEPLAMRRPQAHLQFVAARSGGELFYADHVCDCREAVSMWVRDYVWTQMIWLPGNMLFLLIWIALAVKLWSGKRSAG